MLNHDTPPTDAVHEAWRTVMQFSHWLELCECGDGPPVVLAHIDVALSWFDRSRGDMFEPGTDRSGDVWLYLLDVWKLTQHGGSVYGSWLTPAGKRLRSALKRVDLNAWDEVTGESGSWWDREAELQPKGEVLSYGTWQPDA